MNRTEITNKISEYVKSKQLGETTGHDWWHTYRVWQTAKKIGQLEKADLFIVELAALLHDLDDWKFNNNNDVAVSAKKLLEEYEVATEVIDHVCEIIKDLSFKGVGVATPMKSIEGKVVQDADRLDALGAIGIARAFTTGVTRGRVIYDPESMMNERVENFKIKDSRSTIHHFYDKLFLLKDLMNTETAKSIAKERHEFMEEFVREFLKEWDEE